MRTDILYWNKKEELSRSVTRLGLLIIMPCDSLSVAALSFYNASFFFSFDSYPAVPVVVVSDKNTIATSRQEAYISHRLL